MKIVLCGFHQEINSFAPGFTEYESFAREAAVFGADMIHLAKTHVRRNESIDMLSAAYRVISAAGAEVISGGFMTAQSGPIIRQKVLDDYIEKLSDTIRANLPVDGVVIVMHGAAQAEKTEDPEGRIAATVRNLVGKDAVISVCVDLHANITSEIVRNVDTISGYQQYPHIDMYETGLRAATLCLRTVRGEISPKMAYTRVPMIVPASGYTTGTPPFSDLMAKGHRLVDAGKLLDFSVFQMQPWLDVSVGGSCVIAIGEDADGAKSISEEMAAELYRMRHAFRSELHSVDEIIDIAEKNTSEKPVILNDFADSSNAGAAGDSAEVLRRLIERGSDLSTLMYLNDADLVAECRKVGVGNRISSVIGGKVSKILYAPVPFEGEIKGLFDGLMSFGPDSWANMGPSAVLKIRNAVVIVTTEHHFNGDTRLYRCFGYDPVNFRMVVVKACTSFRAFYGPLTDLIYPAATKGPASSDLLSFPFAHLPRNFYPFRDADDFVPKALVVSK